MAIGAAIFDLDGTLLDSTDVWAGVDSEFLRRRGFAVPADYAATVSALGFYEAAVYTIARFSLPDTPQALIDEWNRLAVQAYGTTVPLKPYAKEYLRRLRAGGCRLALATGASPALYEAALRRHGLWTWFDVICSVEDVARGKEFPDIFLHAAAQLGVSPGECLVFEDILPAIRAAKQAGMRVYGVYDKASAASWDAIKRYADGTLYDFKEVPLCGLSGE